MRKKWGISLLSLFLSSFLLTGINEAKGRESLFTESTPSSKKVEKLSPFFDPIPGSMVRVSQRDQEANKKKNPFLHRGYILVTPPSGKCLTITVSEEEPDEKVCQKRSISFNFHNLEEDGSFSIKVFTGKDDFGTDLTWETPHRIGRYIPMGQEFPSRGNPIAIDRCEATVNKRFGKRITIVLANLKKWVVSIPDEEYLIPQPPDIRRLMTFRLMRKGGIDVDVLNDEQARRRAEREKENKKRREIAARNLLWEITERYTFEIGASRFMSDGPNPPGMRGRCRYNYKVDRDDPKSGWIECHEVSGYRWLSIPLPCLNDLAQYSDH